MTKAERGRTCEQRVVVSGTNLTHKTATMAFRMRSCSERCSMNTSACGTVRYRKTQGFRKGTNLINQDDRLPRRGDIKSTLQGLIDLRGCNTQVTSPNHIQGLANVFRCGLGGQCLSTTGRAEEVDDETLTLSLNEIVKSKVLVMGHHEGLEQLLSPSRKNKVLERFVVPLNVGSILNVEFDWKV